MAVTWFETFYLPETQRRSDWQQTEVTHVGRVVKMLPGREIRIMSDVWCDVFHCVVLTDDGSFDRVRVGDNSGLSCKRADVVIDAPGEVIARYEAETKADAERAAAQEAARRAERHERERIARAQAEHDRPVTGKRMTVVSGRKVAKGTTGKVFFVRDNRVGLALSDAKDAKGWAKDVAWVEAKHLRNVEATEAVTSSCG